MELLLNNDDITRLAEAALAGKARVRSLECDANRLRVKVALGVLPATVEFTDFRLGTGSVSCRIVGALATKVLGLFREKVEQAGVQVIGDELRMPLPEALTAAGEITALDVSSHGIRLGGRLKDLSGLMAQAGISS
jgi:hypothetical protein